MAKKTVAKKVRSVVPIYVTGLVFLMCCAFLPMYTFLYCLLIILITALAYASARKIFPGKTVETEEFDYQKTGSSDADTILAQGKRFLETLNASKDKIANDIFRTQLQEIITDAEGIFDFIVKNPKSAGLVKSFSAYYLPQTIKIVETYIEFSSAGVVRDELGVTSQKLAEAMPDIVSAFDAQLSNLYSDKAFDIRTDLKVLESVLRDSGIK